jgi:hypothetical protein
LDAVDLKSRDEQTIQKMRQELLSGIDHNCFYDDPLLSSVYNFSEIVTVFQKTRKQVLWAMTSGKLKFRKAIGSGNYFITRNSAVKLWGEPLFDHVQEVYKEELEAQLRAEDDLKWS